jgi:hypothetical protein
LTDSTAGTIPFTIENAAPNNLLWLDSTSRIGILTDVPDGTLHVMTSSATAAGVGDLIVEHATVPQINILGATDGTLAFGNASDADVGRIYYNHGSNYMSFWTGATAAERVRISSVGVGIGVDPAQKFEIGSADNSDRITLYHNNTNAYMKWDDGSLVVQTDEGTNTDTTIKVHGKGTGRAQLEIHNVDDNAYLELKAVGTYSTISQLGGGANGLYIQPDASQNVSFFQFATEGETKELNIRGFRTGDAGRTLAIGCGVDAADTASFDGVGNYCFDGNLGVNTWAPDGTCHIQTSSAAASGVGDLIVEHATAPQINILGATVSIITIVRTICRFGYPERRRCGLILLKMLALG